MSAAAPPAWERFPAETLRAFFDAVEINDVVDAEVALPDPIVTACTRETMARCFALCLQFWTEGVARPDLAGLVNDLVLTGDLDADRRTRYKYIRARYKQLRFALMLYGIQHEAPPVLLATVGIMGQLQDAFRHGRRGAARGHALVLGGLLLSPLWAYVRHRVTTIVLDTEAGFLAWREKEIGALRELLAQEALTGTQFHDMRKIVSRQVSFYDALRTLAPNDHDFKMSRYLSAINGLMGRRHDEMVEEAAAGRQDYGRPVPLAPDIKARLSAFVDHYPA